MQDLRDLFYEELNGINEEFYRKLVMSSKAHNEIDLEGF